jgi:hypothetical protein
MSTPLGIRNDPSAAAPVQPVLFSMDDAGIYAEEPSPARAGRFSAEQVKARTPDRYALALDLLAAGHGVIHIARLLQMSAHTVRAIREANPEPIAQAREKMIRRLHTTGALALEAILEDLEDPARRAKIQPAQKGVLFGILNDHALKMTGQPTSITATLEARPGHDAAAEYLARMTPAENPQASPAPWPELVCPAQTLPPKREGAGELAGAGLEEVDGAPASPSRDSLSRVLPHNHGVSGNA